MLCNNHTGTCIHVCVIYMHTNALLSPIYYIQYCCFRVSSPRSPRAHCNHSVIKASELQSLTWHWSSRETEQFQYFITTVIAVCKVRTGLDTLKQQYTDHALLTPSFSPRLLVHVCCRPYHFIYHTNQSGFTYQHSSWYSCGCFPQHLPATPGGHFDSPHIPYGPSVLEEKEARGRGIWLDAQHQHQHWHELSQSSLWRASGSSVEGSVLISSSRVD